MNTEIQALTWAAVLTSVMWMPYVTSRMFTLGVWGVFAYPPKSDAPNEPPAWADRSKRAHTNAVENLVVFGALIVAVELTGGGDGTTALAAWVYVGARIAHWVLYLAGVPVLRTMSFLAGWVCQLVLAAYVLF